MARLVFELVTPEGVKFAEEVYEVVLPTPRGQIGILPHHIPLVSIVSAGVISIRRHENGTYEEREHIAVSGGFVEIDGKRVRLLADSADRAEDINELKAKQALERAQELKQTAKDHVTLADAIGLIEMNTARLKIAELKRRRRR